MAPNRWWPKPPGTKTGSDGWVPNASRMPGDGHGCARLLERLPQTVACQLSGPALSGLDLSRENPLPPDQQGDRQPPEAGEQKGRGYEWQKGKYVEIEPEELDAVKIESSHSIDIDSFVPREEIDRRYLNHPYYIVPDGKAALDAFAVIRDAMKDQDRVALARIVLTNREHVMAIEPLGKGLLGTTLRYPYELRDESEYFDDIKSPKISRDMIELASHILDTKAAHFEPNKFTDDYETALKALVRRKAAGKPIKAAAPEERPSNVVSLMDALKASLKKPGAKGAARMPARRQSSHRPTAKKVRRPAARRRKGGLRSAFSR